MRDGERRAGPAKDRAGSGADLAFAAFSLTHAECGEEGAIEFRLGDRLLLGWCPSCAALKTFRSLDEYRRDRIGRRLRVPPPDPR
jgi:hypothetical protein